MRAAVVHEFGSDLVIEKTPIPEIKSHEILVKIMASGVCHTDLHAANGDWPIKPALPFIPGHEGVGIVAKAGSLVKNIKEGDRVGIPWLYTTCGCCSYCLSGWETLCLAQKNTGFSLNGCYAEYVVADPNYVAHLPANLDFNAAASLICAGLTVYKGIKETDTKPGDWLIISGIGGLGHLAIQYAKAMGRKTIAIDIHEHQLKLAKEFQADIIINASREDPVKRVHKEIKGAHGILATAVSSDSFAQAIAMLRPKGTLTVVGLPPGNFTIPAFDLVMNRKTIRGSIVGTRQDLVECLAFAEEGKVKVHFQMDKLENINDIFKEMKKSAIVGRIVMQM